MYIIKLINTMITSTLVRVNTTTLLHNYDPFKFIERIIILWTHLNVIYVDPHSNGKCTLHPVLLGLECTTSCTQDLSSQLLVPSIWTHNLLFPGFEHTTSCPQYLNGTTSSPRDLSSQLLVPGIWVHNLLSPVLEHTTCYPWGLSSQPLVPRIVHNLLSLHLTSQSFAFGIWT